MYFYCFEVEYPNEYFFLHIHNEVILKKKLGIHSYLCYCSPPAKMLGRLNSNLSSGSFKDICLLHSEPA